MTVKLICDLCKTEVILEPGEHSTANSSYGWLWAKAASFHASLKILDETICEKCNQEIKISRHNAEVAIRERLRND